MKGIDESLSSIFPGPQSPCERTDLRMAIVADHLGLSWTGENIQHYFFLSQAPSTSLFIFAPSVLTCVIYCHLQANRISYPESMLFLHSP